MSRPEFLTIRLLKTYGLILFIALSALSITKGYAEETPAPPEKTSFQADSVPAPDTQTPAAITAPAPVAGHVNVIELFSSRLCAFCPQAEDYFHTLIEQPGLIGLACHISYFEADASPLTQKFCAERQNRYNATLHLGPNYTPQMLINGTRNAVGYKTNRVEEALAASQKSAPFLLDIKKIRDKSYQFSLPALGHDFQGEILVALIDKPHRLQGLNPKDPPSVFMNAVSALIDAGPWDGTARTLDVQVDLRAENKGFVVLAQETGSLRIAAAGQYLEP